MTKFDYKGEFEHYLYVIQKVMDPDGSFLELGPGKFSLSNHFPNITILDNDIELLRRYVEKERRVIQGNYHSHPFLPNSFDYVVAIHPDLYDSGKNIEWIDSDDVRFKFESSGLENFVSSLFNIAQKKVFIASKAIADHPPLKEFATQVVTSPYSFVLYEKSLDGGNKNGKFEPLPNSSDAV